MTGQKEERSEEKGKPQPEGLITGYELKAGIGFFWLSVSPHAGRCFVQSLKKIPIVQFDTTFKPSLTLKLLTFSPLRKNQHF